MKAVVVLCLISTLVICDAYVDFPKSNQMRIRLPAGIRYANNDNLQLIERLPIGFDFLVGLQFHAIPQIHHMGVLVNCDVDKQLYDEVTNREARNAGVSDVAYHDYSDPNRGLHLNHSSASLPLVVRSNCVELETVYQVGQPLNQSHTMDPGVGMMTQKPRIIINFHFLGMAPGIEMTTTGEEGIDLVFESRRSGKITKRMNTYVIISAQGWIKPGIQKVELACKLVDPVVRHLTSLMLHTHEHGIKQSVFRITPQGKWDLIKVGYPVWDKGTTDVPHIDLHQGDIIATRCTYNNTEGREIELAGDLGEDMCSVKLGFTMDVTDDPDPISACVVDMKDYLWSKSPLMNSPIPPEVQAIA